MKRRLAAMTTLGVIGLFAYGAHSAWSDPPADAQEAAKTADATSEETAGTAADGTAADSKPADEKPMTRAERRKLVRTLIYRQAVGNEERVLLFKKDEGHFDADTTLDKMSRHAISAKLNAQFQDILEKHRKKKFPLLESDPSYLADLKSRMIHVKMPPVGEYSNRINRKFAPAINSSVLHEYLERDVTKARKNLGQNRKCSDFLTFSFEQPIAASDSDPLTVVDAGHLNDFCGNRALGVAEKAKEKLVQVIAECTSEYKIGSKTIPVPSTQFISCSAETCAKGAEACGSEDMSEGKLMLTTKLKRLVKSPPKSSEKIENNHPNAGSGAL